MLTGEARWLPREAESFRRWAAALRQRPDCIGEQAIIATELEEIADAADLLTARRRHG